MARVLTLTFAGLTALLVLLAWRSGMRGPEHRSEDTAKLVDGEIRRPLYPPDVTSIPRPAASVPSDVVIIQACPITVINKQDVPSQSEGVIRVIGTDVEPSRTLNPTESVLVRVGAETRTMRRLKEDDVVQAGQLLACLDDRLSRDELEIKKSRVNACKAELNSASRSAEEFRTRYETQLRLRETGGAASEEDVRSARLSWDRAAFDALAKREALALAERELSQAETTLRMHEVRAGIPGIVKAIYKRPGEAVKRLEPVVQIQDHSRLRAEGLIDVQHVGRLAVGARVLVEPTRSLAPRECYEGHLGEVTGVAVCPGFDAFFLSSSMDGTVRIWDRRTRAEVKCFKVPVPVLCVAAGMPGSRSGAFVCGGADGTAWAGDLTQLGRGLRELSSKHSDAITAIAISPDGKTCATGSEDREVCLWNLADGSLRYRLPSEHRGGLTFVGFTRRAQIVTASRDNALRLWTLGDAAARLETTFAQRSGDVPRVDVSGDGGRVLYDQGGGVQVLALPSGSTECVLRPEAASLQTFATFSPSGRLVLTASGGDGPLRLWLTSGAGRARDLCQLVAPGCVPSCAVFTPDGGSLVVGTQDRQVLVWSLPSEAELERVIPGELTRVDHAVGPGGKQVRVWAEFLNLEGAVIPGGTATVVVLPEKRER